MENVILFANKFVAFSSIAKKLVEMFFCVPCNRCIKYGWDRKIFASFKFLRMFEKVAMAKGLYFMVMHIESRALRSQLTTHT